MELWTVLIRVSAQILSFVVGARGLHPYLPLSGHSKLLSWRALICIDRRRFYDSDEAGLVMLAAESPPVGPRALSNASQSNVVSEQCAHRIRLLVAFPAGALAVCTFSTSWAGFGTCASHA